MTPHLAKTKELIEGRYRKSFREDYESAANNPDLSSDKPFILGNLDDYDPKEFNWDEDANFKIFIHNRKVMITSFGSGLHEVTSRIINDAIETALNFNSPPGSTNFISQGSTDINVVNLLGCSTRFIKQPDDSITVSGQLNICRIHPGIAIEVGVTHENLELLFNEAVVLLNEFTQIEYCVLIKIYAGHDDFRMKIFVCQRITPQYQCESEEARNEAITDYLAANYQKEGDKKYCSEPFDPCGKPDSEIEKHYPLRIVFSTTITAANIHEVVRFTLRTAGLVRGTGLVMEEEVEIVFTSFIFREILIAFNQYCVYRNNQRRDQDRNQ